MPERTPLYQVIDQDIYAQLGESLESYVRRERAAGMSWSMIAWGVRDIRNDQAAAVKTQPPRAPSWESLRSWFTCSVCRQELSHKLDCPKGADQK